MDKNWKKGIALMLGAVTALTFGTVNASDKISYKSMQRYDDWTGAYVDSIRPHVLSLQKRICDANGITITTEPINSKKDYQSKVHPVYFKVTSTHFGFSTGCGYLAISRGKFGESYPLTNLYNYATAEDTLAHEITHSIHNHSYKKNDKEDSEEYEADLGAIEMSQKFPEGGYGGFYTAFVPTTEGSEPTDGRMRFKKDIEARIQDKLIFDENSWEWTFNGAKNGKLKVEFYGEGFPTLWGDGWQVAYKYYFLGQVIYCMEKGAFYPENLAVVPSESLRNDIPSYMLEDNNSVFICRSPKLIGGYKVLAVFPNIDCRSISMPARIIKEDMSLGEKTTFYPYGTAMHDAKFYDNLLKNYISENASKGYVTWDEVCDHHSGGSDEQKRPMNIAVLQAHIKEHEEIEINTMQTSQSMLYVAAAMAREYKLQH